MQIPGLLFGPASDVQRRCTKAIRAFLKGEPFEEVCVASASIDAASNDAYLVMNGPAPLLAGESHFQMFLLLSTLLEQLRTGRADESHRNAAVGACLKSPWGTLGVLAPRNQILVYPPEWHRPVVRAAVEWWDAFIGVGPRYTVGLREGKGLWDTVTNLQYVLGQIGVPIETLRAPLPPEGLRAIVPPMTFDSSLPGVT